ncbi:MAG TPA: hypothetical protein VGW34_12655 [Allosphingosinicella sp.]|nr:hypothetical protein [Allosphingosinicella sp.]
MTSKRQSERLDAIEETQASLRATIEASRKLIERSDDLLQNCRRITRPDPPPGQEAGC